MIKKRIISTPSDAMLVINDSDKLTHRLRLVLANNTHDNPVAAIEITATSTYESPYDQLQGRVLFGDENLFGNDAGPRDDKTHINISLIPRSHEGLETIRQRLEKAVGKSPRFGCYETGYDANIVAFLDGVATKKHKKRLSRVNDCLQVAAMNTANLAQLDKILRDDSGGKIGINEADLKSFVRKLGRSKAQNDCYYQSYPLNSIFRDEAEPVTVSDLARAGLISSSMAVIADDFIVIAKEKKLQELSHEEQKKKCQLLGSRKPDESVIKHYFPDLIDNRSIDNRSNEAPARPRPRRRKASDTHAGRLEPDTYERAVG